MERYTHLSFQHAEHSLKDIAKLTLPAREVPHAFTSYWYTILLSLMNPFKQTLTWHVCSNSRLAYFGSLSASGGVGGSLAFFLAATHIPLADLCRRILRKCRDTRDMFNRSGGHSRAIT